MADILDFTVIEKAVEHRLVEMIPTIRKSAVQKDGRYVFNNPSLTVCIYETGRWVKEGNRAYLVPCELHILLTVTSAKSEEDRRRIVNPLAFAIVTALVQDNLDLPLKDPGIEPMLIRDVTSDEDWKENKIIYLVQFSLGFYFQVPKDEDQAADLIGIAIDYFSESADVLTAQDELSP